ncbi:general secretion pathway protein GspD [Bdellovibrio sp. ZAP7]|uniref:general secretion pathway protein GspD n=1 Tax=Bdellovibrio sp. ZAP7 TaxID=2231053 RepID=UPI00115B2211|nr:general secretion pathway protein GspD [Bdellovibrio sp. ZAP7]QDK44829.1 general secretion pathway protein GspD [Bdellovibrio sp. ZAP7]
MKWIILALLSLSVVAASASDKIKFNFLDTEVSKMIEAYSKSTGQKFVVDPSVRGKASIFVQEPITTEEAFNQLSSALAVNGFAISKQGDTMIVKSARNIQRDLIEVSTEVPALKPERMATWIYTFKNIAAAEVNRSVRIMPSRDGEMNTFDKNNQIIFTDWTSNLNRMAAILKELDKPADPAAAKLAAEDKKGSMKREASKKKEETKTSN